MKLLPILLLAVLVAGCRSPMRHQGEWSKKKSLSVRIHATETNLTFGAFAELAVEIRNDGKEPVGVPNRYQDMRGLISCRLHTVGGDLIKLAHSGPCPHGRLNPFAFSMLELGESITIDAPFVEVHPQSLPDKRMYVRIGDEARYALDDGTYSLAVTLLLRPPHTRDVSLTPEALERLPPGYHNAWTGNITGTIELNFSSQGGPSPSLPTTHLPQKGETLSSIAKKYYGPNAKEGLQAILKANPWISNDGMDNAGKKLVIPKLGKE